MPQIKRTHAIAVFALLSISIVPMAARLHKGQAQLSNHNHLDTNRFTGPGQVWPPQPKNRTNVVWLTQTTDGFRSNLQSKGRTGSTLSSEDIPELGSDFTYIGETEIQEKGSPGIKKRMTFFSHSNNATVEVVTQGDNIERTERVVPSKYQPPLTSEEVEKAVDIARKSLIDSGFDRVGPLKGYGILAFKSSAETVPGEGGFYDTRVAYVSFHEHIDARPEYVAWVDLTQQLVLKSRED